MTDDTEGTELNVVKLMDELRAIPLDADASERFAEYLAQIQAANVSSHHEELLGTLDEVFDMHDFGDQLLDAELQVTKNHVANCLRCD